MLAVGLALFASSASAGIVIFYDDFDGGQRIASGVTGGWSGVTSTESVQGYSGLGTASNTFSGLFLRNDTPSRPGTPPHKPPATEPPLKTTLTLSGLPSHTSIDIGFLLAIIDSWDGASSGLGNSLQTDDIFNVALDGAIVFSHAFDEVVVGDNYTPPPGGLLVLHRQLGFTNLGPTHGFHDSAYDMTIEPTLLKIPHTSSTLRIDLYASGKGYEGGNSESWAIESFSLTLHGAAVVPEPSSLAIFGAMGMGGLVIRLRGRRVMMACGAGFVSPPTP